MLRKHFIGILLLLKRVFFSILTTLIMLDQLDLEKRHLAATGIEPTTSWSCDNSAFHCATASALFQAIVKVSFGNPLGPQHLLGGFLTETKAQQSLDVF